MNELSKPESMSVLPAYRVSRDSTELPELPEIPRARYTDEAFYQAEIEHVFKKIWLQVAHTSEFEAEGSYRTLDLPFAPVVIVRGKDEKLRAFINSCRHRGSKITRDEKGQTRVLSCVYHRWNYDLTGDLIGLPEQECFKGLVKEDHSLQSVHCELWGGFVFISMAKDPAPFEEWIRPMARRYNLQAEAPLRIVSKKTYDLNCNWKFANDAFQEPYHVATVHPESVALSLNGYGAFQEMYPNGGGSLCIPYTENILEQAFAGVPLNQTTLAKLPGMEDKNETTLLANFFPNLIVGFQPMGFPLIITWPIAVDRCRMDVFWYGMDWGDGEMPEAWNKIVSDFDMLTKEDLACLEGIHEATAADPEKGIPLSTLEIFVYQSHIEIDRCIGAENITENLRVPDPDILNEYISP